MRLLALTLLWLLAIVAVFATLVFGALVPFGEDGDTRLGGAMIAAFAVAVFFAARAGIRRLNRPAPPTVIAIGGVVTPVDPIDPASPSLNPRDYGLPE